MPVPWNGDDPRDLPVLTQNLRRVLRRIVQRAPDREPPSISMAQGWHREIYREVRLPVPYYAGEFRDSDPDLPELYGYEVAVGPHPGVLSAYVPEQLKAFERFLVAAVDRLDPVVLVGEPPAENPTLHSVLTLCALSHGEWVRIHPFANGNGRTARLWGNWCAVRYGLPPFIRLQPRPRGDAYATAAKDSMRGDHRAMVIVLVELLADHLED